MRKVCLLDRVSVRSQINRDKNNSHGLTKEESTIISLVSSEEIVEKKFSFSFLLSIMIMTCVYEAFICKYHCRAIP